MNSEYAQFLSNKRAQVKVTGFDVPVRDINPKLFKYQNACVRRALQVGKYALFEECGLGKTVQEMEWSQFVAAHTAKPVLQLAPLAVAYQSLNEASKFGYELHYCESQADVGDSKVVITNYERLHLFDASAFGGVVLDESSILKSFMGTTKRAILSAFKATPFKLCASATPAPNDVLELGNHAEFLDIMPSNEMIARWFINNSNKAGDYRLKKHAAKDFWRWITSWAVFLSNPADLGPDYEIDGYNLPPLRLHEHFVATSQATIERSHAEGLLLPNGNPSSMQLGKVKRESLISRVDETRAIVEGLPEGEFVIVWCELNAEADALKAAFPDAIEVRGDDRHKEAKLRAFSEREAPMLITKPSIAGYGLNLQFVGTHIDMSPNFSFEQWYQKIRRSWRYGRTEPVDVYLIATDTLDSARATIRRKETQFKTMQKQANAALAEHGLFRGDGARRLTTSIGTVPMALPDWLTSKQGAA